MNYSFIKQKCLYHIWTTVTHHLQLVQHAAAQLLAWSKKYEHTAYFNSRFSCPQLAASDFSNLVLDVHFALHGLALSVTS